VIPRLIGDPAFAAGALPFAVLMAGVILASPILPFAHVLLMARHPGWHTVLLVVTLAINLAGTVLWIPRLGITGAALSIALTLVISSLLLRALARARIGVRL
jgi:O-antigen/teichoic acid export membrane protein